ncbi:MAG: amino acid-binding protein [Micromonosporaceae bacterium]|nr:amino acid-binding protein [Micromonosporaceae bacterium]
MLLRVRVALPDRPGSLGQVARTLGVCGADIVQVVVLERLLAGLAAVPGVRVDGVWGVVGAPTSGGPDAQLLGQIASDPADGLATLVDAAPGLLAADWAAALAVPDDWADRRRDGAPAAPAVVVRASWRAADRLVVPELPPLRARSLAGPDGARYAVAPFERAGLVLLVARVDGGELPPAGFHRTEVDRLAELVRAAAAVLGERLALIQAPPVGV